MNDERNTDRQTALESVQELATRFVDLANAMKDEGHSTARVNGGLMFASCIYATYSAAGNEGYLQDTGVNKVTAVYRRNLMTLQKLKRNAQSP